MLFFPYGRHGKRASGQTTFLFCRAFHGSGDKAFRALGLDKAFKSVECLDAKLHIESSLKQF